eukprot:1186570-Prorocentrum_minimum.AAC.6
MSPRRSTPPVMLSWTPPTYVQQLPVRLEGGEVPPPVQHLQNLERLGTRGSTHVQHRVARLDVQEEGWHHAHGLLAGDGARVRGRLDELKELLQHRLLAQLVPREGHLPGHLVRVPREGLRRGNIIATIQLHVCEVQALEEVLAEPFLRAHVHSD